MDYKTFRNILDRYYSLQESKRKLEEAIDVLWYELSGVKSIRYDKEPSTYNPTLTNERRNRLSEELEEKNIELDFTMSAIKMIEYKLSKLDEKEREVCLKVVTDKISLINIGKEIGYSESGVWYYVKRLIEKVI